MTKKIWLFIITVLGIPLCAYAVFIFYERHFETLPILGPLQKINEIYTYHTIPYFEFTDQKGKKCTLSDFNGKIMVVDFFFTYCPGICPKMSLNLQDVQAEFIDDKEVIILSYTVDPERDNVDRLAEYAKKYHSKTGKWFFLTGEKSDIYQLAHKGYMVTAQDIGESSPDDFIHSEKLILIDQEKRIRGYYDGTDKKEVIQLIRDIKKLKQ